MLRALARIVSLTVTIATLTPLAIFGYLQSLFPRSSRSAHASRRALVVTPFRPSQESGGARAVLELEQSLEGRGAQLEILSLRDEHLSWGVRGMLSTWLSRTLPVPPSCRPILLGSDMFIRTLANADLVVFEFFASALAMFLQRPLSCRTVLRDHEVLLRKLAVEYRAATGLDAVALALRCGVCYLVSVAVYSKVSRIVALTEEDAASLRKYFPWLGAKVVSIPVSFSMPTRPQRDDVVASVRDLVMVGNFFHTPNVDALRWFLAECAPHLEPGFTLHVFGIDSPLDALNLADHHVRLIRNGFVNELEPALPRVAIALSPVISGGGVRMKNLLLASLALPVVTTPLGNEGIGFADGVEAIVSSEGREMATRINALANTPADVAMMGRRGRAFVEAHFGAAGAGDRLMAEVFPGWAPTTVA